MTRDLIAGILAGGKSRRYGKDKCWEKYKGKYLIEWVIENTLNFTENIYIIAKGRDKFLSLGFPIIEDIYPESTPLSGILSIFPHVEKWLLLLACDIPFFKKEVLEFMWEEKEEGKACVVRINGEFQPFLAFYPKEVFNFWEEAYKKGERKLQKIIKDMPKKIIEEKELFEIDPFLLSFTNINYPEDLEKLEEILK